MTIDSAVQVSGPVPGSRMTAGYVGEVARFAYLWAWPMVNLHNRLSAFAALPGPGLMGSVVPVAPPNSVAMLHDYITPDEKMVACPNQDVVYGFGPLAPAREPVVVQIPDFGDRFWVYQLCDQRTDGFAELGAMYGTSPGCYLVVGADWSDPTPDGIAGLLRCPTAVGICIPRVFMDDTDADRSSIQPLINQIAVYPLSEFTGVAKTVDWQGAPIYPTAADASSGDAETRWVFPEQFADSLAAVLDEVPALPGEEALYQQYRSVLSAISQDSALRDVFTAAAVDADRDLIEPLFQFHNYGVGLPHHWTTMLNNSSFGTDYLTRAAAAGGVRCSV
jgi:hypothetical protein